MKTIISWLTMKRERCLFVDRVTGKEVFLYTDRYGDKWMAEWNRFFFRVPLGGPREL